MPQQTQSPNGQVMDFSGLRLPPQYETVTCEIDDVNEGLTRPLEITVLVNPTRGEIVAMSQALERVFTRVQARLKTQLEAAKEKESGGGSSFDIDLDVERADDLEIGDIIAPRIVGWNVEALKGGELVDVPAPGQKGGNDHFPMGADAIPGGGVMEVLSQAQKNWIRQIVQFAHMGGETRSKLSTRPAATADITDEKPPSGPQVASTPTGHNRPKRRKRS